ncbi:MAG: hypothetical protein ACYDEX_26580, partial [Mobilitalea sp.]
MGIGLDNNENLFEFVKVNSLGIKVLLSNREMPTLNLITVKKNSNNEYKIMSTYFSETSDILFPVKDRYIMLSADGGWINKEPTKFHLDELCNDQNNKDISNLFAFLKNQTNLKNSGKRPNQKPKYKDCYDFQQFRQVARAYAKLIEKRQHDILDSIARDYSSNEQIVLLREQCKISLKVNKKYCSIEGNYLYFSIDKYLEHDNNFFASLNSICEIINLKPYFEENLYILGTYILFMENKHIPPIYDVLMYFHSTIKLAYLNILESSKNNVKTEFHKKIKDCITDKIINKRELDKILNTILNLNPAKENSFDLSSF